MLTVLTFWSFSTAHVTGNLGYSQQWERQLISISVTILWPSINSNFVYSPYSIYYCNVTSCLTQTMSVLLRSIVQIFFSIVKVVCWVENHHKRIKLWCFLHLYTKDCTAVQKRTWETSQWDIVLHDTSRPNCAKIQASSPFGRFILRHSSVIRRIHEFINLSVCCSKG